MRPSYWSRVAAALWIIAAAAAASGQTQRSWPVYVVEPDVAAPVRIEHPATQLFYEDGPVLELSFLARNMSAEALPTAPGQAARLRVAVTLNGLNPPADETRIVLSLKTVPRGSGRWEQREAPVRKAQQLLAGVE
jgi:hypothetical protein